MSNLELWGVIRGGRTNIISITAITITITMSSTTITTTSRPHVYPPVPVFTLLPARLYLPSYPASLVRTLTLLSDIYKLPQAPATLKGPYKEALHVLFLNFYEIVLRKQKTQLVRVSNIF
jgi:hypothetical protein